MEYDEVQKWFDEQTRELNMGGPEKFTVGEDMDEGLERAVSTGFLTREEAKQLQQMWRQHREQAEQSFIKANADLDELTKPSPGEELTARDAEVLILILDIWSRHHDKAMQIATQVLGRVEGATDQTRALLQEDTEKRLRTLALHATQLRLKLMRFARF